MLKQSALIKKMTAGITALALATTLAPTIAAPGQAHADEPAQPKAELVLTAQANSETLDQADLAQIAQNTTSNLTVAGSNSPLRTQSVGNTDSYKIPTVKLGRSFTGTIWTDGSYAYYKFATSNESGVRYKATYKITHIAGQRLTSMDYKKYGKFGSSVTKRLKPNSTGLFHLGGLNLNTSVPVRYTVKIVAIPDKPTAPAIKSVKAGKRQLTVKYSPSKYANRYQVKIGGKTYNNGKKLSKAVKHLKAGKTYKVKVRAQRQFKGKWYSGKWSSVKKVKVRK